MKPILVVGGINMDVLAMPSAEFAWGDSLIGRIRLSPGGVGRNMAEQLARHSIPVELMAVLGEDDFANSLRQSCKELNIGLRHAISSSEHSCAYLAVHDAQGDMVIAINDMAAMSALNIPAIGSLPKNSFSACVLDANLSEESLIAAAHHLSLPLIADPVSCAKAKRLLPIMPMLKAIKPNLIEALLLSGQDNEADAASALLGMGVEQVYISMGENGLYCANGKERHRLPAHHAPLGPSTGAGDAMTAGLAAALARGKNLLECALNGMRFAEEHLSRMAALHNSI